MTDIASLNIRINSLEAKMAKQDLDRLTGAGQKSERQMGTMSKAAARLGTALAAAFSTYQMTQFIKTATLAYARFETLGVVMNTVGRNAGYSSQEMAGFETQLRQSGIAMTETRATLTRMTQAQIDLTKSSELARIAQDAAVIGNINSSQAFEKMIHGIQSAQVEVLRTIGLNVNFEQSYKKLADQLDITTAELTEAQKTQARVNVVMEAGTRIAGVYEAAMDTAGKKFGSMSRHVDDLMVVIGKTFNQTFADGIDSVTEILKSTRAWVEANEKLLQMGFDEGLSKTVDILKVLVVLIGARLTASLVQSSSALAFQTQQWAAYQLTLARGAGLSKTVAAGQVAMAAAVGIGSRSLALVGGPAGAATLAGIAIYNFREELHLVPPDADKAVSAIDKVIGSLKNLTAAQVENKRFQLIDELDKQVENLKRLEAEYNRIAAIAGDDGSMYGKADEGTKRLATLKEEIEKVAGGIDRLESSLDLLEIFPTAQNDAENLRRVANAMDHARGEIPPLKKEVKDLADQFSYLNHEMYEKDYGSEDDWKAGHERLENLKQEIAYMEDWIKAVESGKTTQEATLEIEEKRLRVRLANEDLNATEIQHYIDLLNATGKLTQAEKDRIKATDDFNRAQDRAAEEFKRKWKRAYDDMHKFAADTFYDLFDGSIGDFEDFTDKMLDIFKRMLANMVAEWMMSGLFKGDWSISGGSGGGLLGNIGTLFGGSGGSGGGFNLSSLSNLSKVGNLFSSGSTIGANYGNFSNSVGILGQQTGLWGGGLAQGTSTYSLASGVGAGQVGGVGSTTPLGGNAGLGGLGAGAATLGFAAFAGFVLSKMINRPDKPKAWFQSDPSNTSYDWRQANIDRETGKLESSTISRHVKLGQKSQNFDYWLRWVDIDDQGVQQATYDFFDNRFKAYEEMFDISMNKVLKESSFMEGSGNLANGGSLEGMMSGVFEGIRAQLITALFPDSKMLEWSTFESQGSIFDGSLEFTEMKHQVSELAFKLNKEFFEAITPEGGTEFEAFAQFANVVQNTEGFMEDFTRRTEEMGQSTLDAYTDIQTVSTILSAIQADLDGMATSTAWQQGFDNLNLAFDAMIAQLNEAAATSDQVAEALAAQNQMQGAYLTGLTGASVEQALMSGGNIQQVVGKQIQAAMASDFASELMEQYFETFNDAALEAFQAGGPEAVGQLFKDFDWGAVNEDIKEFFNVLNEGADEVEDWTKIIEESERRLAATERELASAENILTRSFDAEKDRLQKAYDREIDSLNDRLSAASSLVGSLTGYVNMLENARNRMFLDTPGFREMQYSSARSSLSSALSSARGGDFEPLKDLEEPLSVLTKQGTEAYANSTDYERDFWKTYVAISELEDLTGKQLTSEEQMVQLLENQIEQANATYENEIAVLDQQLNALLQIDTSVLSLADAIAQYQNALSAMVSAQKAANQARNTGGGGGRNYDLASAEGVYDQVFGRTVTDDLTQSELDYWNDAQATHGWSAQQLRETMIEAGKAWENIGGEWFKKEGFATGGSFMVGGTGGIDSVSLPGLRVSPGEMVNVTRPDVMSGLGAQVDALRQEARAIKEEIKQLRDENRNTIRHTERTSSTLWKWDQDGLPEERT